MKTIEIHIVLDMDDDEGDYSATNQDIKDDLNDFLSNYGYPSVEITEE